MAAGYLYVLVNSSLPGLVKVGKTTRDPTDRAQELSNATGVPTPFVLAFDSYFADCDAAEQYVHTELEIRGLRESKNREFFRAPSAEVIKILLTAPGKTSYVSEIIENNDHYSGEDDELISASTRNDKEFSLEINNPWHNILEKAEEYYNGGEN